MKRSFKLVTAFLVLVIAAALMPNVAAARSQPSPSTAPSYSGENPDAALDQLAETIEIIIGNKNKKNKKLKVRIDGCAPGQNRDPNTGVCFSCSHNDHFENGRCVPCKAGFHEEGDECVADVKKKKTKKKQACPAGTEFRDGKCRKSEFPEIENCPEGQNADPNTGVCFSCSHNDHFDAARGKCVPCRQGFHVEGDECVAD